MKATVYPGADGWRWRITGLNNEIVASGESYVRRIDAESVLHQIFSTETLDVSIRDHGDGITAQYSLRRFTAPAAAPEPGQLELPFEEGDK